jgi:gluconolactonase
MIATDAMSHFASGLDHPEGLCVDPRGTVWAGGEAGQVYRIEDAGPVVVAATGGFTAGLAADGDGHIYACDFAKACVWRVDPATGAHVLFCDRLGDQPLRAPNWGAFGPDGSYYVSDSGGFGTADGCVGVVRPGAAGALWTDAAPRVPNGLAVTPEGDALVVVESNPSPRLVRVPIRSDGSAGAPELLATFPATEWPDGVACAEGGALVVSCYRPDRIYLWTPAAGLSVLAEDPLGVILAAPTNIAFYGAELDEILSTNLGRWHLTRVPAGIRGTRLHYPTLEGTA